MTCQIPFTPAMASSILRVTWVSSSPGAAPDWVIDTWTIGISIFGMRVIGSDLKLNTPRITSTNEVTIAGIGDRIDHADMFILIARLPGARRAPLLVAPHHQCARMRPRVRRLVVRRQSPGATRSNYRW